MRNFRYIEPGHGRKSMTKEETDNAYIYLDIRTEDYYALMPVTKEEFNLVNSVEKYNREFPGVFEDSLMPAPEPEIPNDHIITFIIDIHADIPMPKTYNSYKKNLHRISMSTGIGLAKSWFRKWEKIRVGYCMI